MMALVPYLHMCIIINNNIQDIMGPDIYGIKSKKNSCFFMALNRPSDTMYVCHCFFPPIPIHFVLYFIPHNFSYLNYKNHALL
jgi:hypothetical protein